MAVGRNFRGRAMIKPPSYDRKGSSTWPFRASFPQWRPHDHLPEDPRRRDPVPPRLRGRSRPRLPRRVAFESRSRSGDPEGSPGHAGRALGSICGSDRASASQALSGDLCRDGCHRLQRSPEQWVRGPSGGDARALPHHSPTGRARLGSRLACPETGRRRRQTGGVHHRGDDWLTG